MRKVSVVKIFLNGMEMEFAEGGYEYVFMKPYHRHTEDVINKENGDKLRIQLYDNGVQIRTLKCKDEINTLINRDVAIDTRYNKIYILEPGNNVQHNPDGSVEVS